MSARNVSQLPGLDIAEAKSWQNYLESALCFHATQNRRLRAEHQLSLIDLQMLDILSRSPTGSARMGDLAGTIKLIPNHLTKRIRRLTTQELVRRTPILEDRRGVLAVITDGGRHMARQATATYTLGVKTHLIGPLSRPQVSAMGENCLRISVVADLTGTQVPMDQLPGLDDLELRCWRRYVDSSQHLLTTVNGALTATHQLTLFDALMLYVLASSDGSARMSDLAALLRLTPSRVTHQIGRLETRGLVRRSPSPGDWRGVIADITGDGRARVRPAVETYTRVIRTHYLDRLTRRQMIALGDNCRRINTSLKAAGTPTETTPT
jgi:DNA-binding MarR family transcriptional regulator